MTRPVQLIIVPYDSGKIGERFGRGPLKALELHRESPFPNTGGLEPQVVTHGGGFATEGSAAFLLARGISGRVSDARGAGAFPLVVAGNCMTSLGTVAGMGGERPGVLWLDTHPDYNTPETTNSGFMDGMGAAALVGDAWRAACAAIPGYRAVAKERLLFLGIRDIESAEGRRMAEDRIAIVAPEELRDDPMGALAACARIGAASDAVYVHFDMDVLDPDPVPANEFAAPGGPTLRAALDLLDRLPERVPIAAAAITAWDPGLDRNGVMLDAYRQVIARFCTIGSAA